MLIIHNPGPSGVCHILLGIRQFSKLERYDQKIHYIIETVLVNHPTDHARSSLMLAYQIIIFSFFGRIIIFEI